MTTDVRDCGELYRHRMGVRKGQEMCAEWDVGGPDNSF